MPRERLSMRLIRETLRLRLQLGLSANKISATLQISRGKVQETLRRAKEEKLAWPLPDALEDDDKLESLLFPEPIPVRMLHPDPDWSTIDRELRKKGVTRRLVWEEYIAENPSGLSYQQFCKRLARWRDKRDVVMLQDHKAGDRLFVDFAGHTIKVTNRDTGEVEPMEVFVAVLGASNYSYAEACAGQDLKSWIEAHVRTFRYFGGAPNFLVPDNLKSAVTHARRPEPLINRTYQRLAEYYGCGVIPTRKYRPRDKAKVEKGVQVVEQRILAALRNRTFFSLDELNREIRIRLEELNGEPFQKIPGSRKSWFDEVDKPALQKLPTNEFEYEEWTVNYQVPKNYHVTIDSHHYSVPYRLAGDHVDIRHTNSIIEVFHNNLRVASHVRNWAPNQKTTAEEHMPAKHAAYHGVSAERFIEEARGVGPNTTAIIHHVLNSKPQPQLSFDQCFAILRTLKSQYGETALEQACEHALNLRTPGYRIVRQILITGVENLSRQLRLPSTAFEHENIRGPEQFK